MGDLYAQRLARRHAATAVNALVRALDDPARAVPAAIALLDRGYGRPSQAITGPGGAPITFVIMSAIGRAPGDDAAVTIENATEGEAK